MLVFTFFAKLSVRVCWPSSIFVCTCKIGFTGERHDRLCFQSRTRWHTFVPFTFSITFFSSLSVSFSLLVFSSSIEARAALCSLFFLCFFYLLSFSSTRTQQTGNVEENFLSNSLRVLCDGFQSRWSSVAHRPPPSRNWRLISTFRSVSE